MQSTTERGTSGLQYQKEPVVSQLRPDWGHNHYSVCWSKITVALYHFLFSRKDNFWENFDGTIPLSGDVRGQDKLHHHFTFLER